MDFMNRNIRNTPTARTNPDDNVAVLTSKSGESSKKYGKTSKFGGFFAAGTIALLVSIAILIGALAGYFAFGNYGSQAGFVNKNEYQAVFVNVNGTNGGQVYFGKVQSVTSDYIDLTNVFYIQNQSSGSGSSSNSTNSSYTLVKLGCELHAPEDQMVINRSQVYFWENLKSTGQVATKIGQYYKDNPNGQNCSSSSTSNSTNQSSANTPESSTSTTKK